MPNQSILMNSSFVYVSEDEVKEARNLQQTEGNTCEMCSFSGAKGFIVNGGQWIRCFDCNQTKTDKTEQAKSCELSRDAQTAISNHHILVRFAVRTNWMPIKALLLKAAKFTSRLTALNVHAPGPMFMFSKELKILNSEIEL